MDNLKKYYRKNKLAVILIALSIIAIFVGALISAKTQDSMILFYSNSCPHCQTVADYIDANGIKNKISFQEKEVSNSQANATLLERKARLCGLDTEQGLGVPFFFDGSNCIMGDEPIIEYFQNLK